MFSYRKIQFTQSHHTTNFTIVWSSRCNDNAALAVLPATLLQSDELIWSLKKWPVVVQYKENCVNQIGTSTCTSSSSSANSKNLPVAVNEIFAPDFWSGFWTIGTSTHREEWFVLDDWIVNFTYDSKMDVVRADDGNIPKKWINTWTLVNWAL